VVSFDDSTIRDHLDGRFETKAKLIITNSFSHSFSLKLSSPRFLLAFLPMSALYLMHLRRYAPWIEKQDKLGSDLERGCRQKGRGKKLRFR
jgi:hypothetical protein